jgi:ABC-type branched-subunit amino acid transport system ATPase component
VRVAPVLDARDISFSYGRLPVLFGVGFQVDVGDSVALLGTNGAGKSTLLRVISGLERPSRGTVLFEGRDITGLPPHVRAAEGISLIAGGRSVFRDMTVQENLEMQSVTMRDRRERFRQRWDAVLDTFPLLRHRLRQQAGTLSGGEQQQLALAKALILEPKVLCIDELSLGLAPVVVGELLEIVRDIHAQGVSLVVVEQSLNIAAELCDRAIFMEKGEVRFEGPSEELLERDDIARAVFLGGAPV